MNSSLSKDQLLELWNNNLSRWFEKKLKETDPVLYEELMNIEGKGMAEKLYSYLHGKGSCNTCQKPTSFISFDKGYREYCGPTCNAEVRQSKREQTNIKRYGVKNAFQAEEVKQRYKNNLQQKYGEGVVNPSQIEGVIQKKMDNAETKWGGHWMKDDGVKNKMRQSLKQRYGCDNANYIGRENLPEILADDAQLVTLWNEHKSTQGVADALNVSQHTVYLRLKNLVDLSRGHSYPQKQITEFIQSIYNGTIIENDRSVHGGGRNAKHLDIYLPDEKIAFEFCGLYYHSEVTIQDTNYHQNKMLVCEQQGIRLVTIFSDEWFTKQEICKNRIRVILNKAHRTCYARQTTVKPVSAKLAGDFMNEHHIQGRCNSPIRYGAFYKDQLVAVMTFAKPRKSLGATAKEGHYELVRFASNGIVTGVASKLFKNFVDAFQPVSVLSYADRRWNTGGVYSQLGFSDEGLSKAGYWWVENYKVRHHRYKFNKQKLVKDGHDPSLTEAHIMKNLLGMDRIWDCGHQRYIWRA